VKIRVRLNGTDSNPYHKMGLTRNPFPVIPKAEFSAANDLLARLDAEPIESSTHLLELLRETTSEFQEVCLKYFQLGKHVSFLVEVPLP
jgi:hypothetical protein